MEVVSDKYKKEGFILLCRQPNFVHTKECYCDECSCRGYEHYMPDGEPQEYNLDVDLTLIYVERNSMELGINQAKFLVSIWSVKNYFFAKDYPSYNFGDVFDIDHSIVPEKREYSIYEGNFEYHEFVKRDFTTNFRSNQISNIFRRKANAEKYILRFSKLIDDNIKYLEINTTKENPHISRKKRLS